MEKKILNIENLRTSFFTHLGEVQAIRGISLSVNEGEILGIVGESGSGKSVTALSILKLIQYPGRVKEGNIWFETNLDKNSKGQPKMVNLVEKKNKEMRRIRGNEISMIFQDPMTSLNPVYTIGNQIIEVLANHKRDEAFYLIKKQITYTYSDDYDVTELEQQLEEQFNTGDSKVIFNNFEGKKQFEVIIDDILIREHDVTDFIESVINTSQKEETEIQVEVKFTKSNAKKKAIELLSLVGIPSPEKRINNYPHEFSGGMRQRVMIAMALACEPKLLIADEPTTALDVTIQAQILKIMKKLNQKINNATILITHDLGVVAETCDKVVVMYGGLIMEKGTIKHIFNNPSHPYTLGLMKSLPNVEQKQKLIPIEGTPPDLLYPPKGCPFAARCDKAMTICNEELPKMYEVEKDHQSLCWLHHPDCKARMEEV